MSHDVWLTRLVIGYILSLAHIISLSRSFWIQRSKLCEIQFNCLHWHSEISFFGFIVFILSFHYCWQEKIRFDIFLFVFVKLINLFEFFAPVQSFYFIMPGQQYHREYPPIALFPWVPHSKIKEVMVRHDFKENQVKIRREFSLPVLETHDVETMLYVVKTVTI